MKKFLWLILALSLCACARPIQETSPVQAPDALWQKFLSQSHAHKAYRLALSLRFGEKGDTRRVTALLWGNGESALRLDVQAGVGSVVAKILEDGDHFLLFSPLEKRAFFYQGAARPLIKAGVPVPFDLAQLAALLNGDYPRAFGREYSGMPFKAKLGTGYELFGKPGGILLLDSAGLPVAWQEKTAGGWKMEISYNKESKPLPSRLNLSHGNGQQAILLVKEREIPKLPFTQEQMSLILPPDIPLLPLSKFQAARMGK